jgi:hypothetical protein
MAAKTVICPAGISAAKVLSPSVPPSQLAQWVADQGGVDAAAPLILATFTDIRPEGPALYQMRP